MKGAFGLWAAAAPELAHLTDGIKLADSWGTDAHKMLNVPYACEIVLCACPEAHRFAMTSQAPYTTLGPSALAAQQRNGMDFVPEMARRARGVPVYATLRALGRTGVVLVIKQLVGDNRLHHLDQALRDGGNIAVVEVDGLVEPATQRRGVTREYLVSRDFALFNLGYASLRDAHSIRDISLGETPATPDLGKPVTADGGEQFLLAGPHGILPAGPLDMRGTHIRPPRVTGRHLLPSSSA